MLVYGGVENNKYTSATIWLYERGSNHWSLVSPTGNNTVPLPRAFHSSVLLTDDAMVVFGGQIQLEGYPPTVMDELWVWHNLTLTWEQITSEIGPAGRIYHTAAKINDTAFVLFGGKTSISKSVLGVLCDTWVFNFDTMEWSNMTQSPSPSCRFGHASAMVGRKWLIFWGQVYDSLLGHTAD